MQSAPPEDRYSAFRPSASVEDLKTLSDMATSLDLAETTTKKAEEEFDAARAAERFLRERTIPELMAKCGMKEFRTTSGLVLSVRDIVRASIPKASAPSAVAWLDEHGFSGLVKRTVLLEFTRAEEEKARALALRLRDEYSNVQETATVHPMTLSAWVRGQLENGTVLPLELFGVTQFQEAKLR